MPEDLVAACGCTVPHGWKPPEHRVDCSVVRPERRRDVDAIKDVLQLVLEERNEQQRKWRGTALEFSPPEPKHLAILLEEVGEVARALIEQDPASYERECIQVAAVAAAMAEGARRFR